MCLEKAYTLNKIPLIYDLLQAKMSPAENFAEKFGVDAERTEQGMKVKEMISQMPKLVENGSKWYVFDMSWVK